MKLNYGQSLVNLLRERCDNVTKRLWIIVPYIGHSNSIFRIIGRVWLDNPKIDFRIITDLNELTNLNSETLKMFFQFGQIRNLAGVHAKVYIIDDECLVTSANLTSTAFTKRHEVGLFLDQKEARESILLFRAWWKRSIKVGEDDLKPLIQLGNESREEVSGNRLNKLWELPDKPSKTTYWLKPIGVRDSPIDESRTFGKISDSLHFATPSRKPKVYKGDILITYGIGAKRILSVYRATSDVQRVTKKDLQVNKRVKRWPWFVSGYNLTPSFGEKWFEYNFYTTQLVNEYLKRNTDGLITAAGSQNLNALMRGKDKIKLDPRFAEFIISKMHLIAK